MDTLLWKIQKTILAGVYDDDCHLSKLKGCPHILKTIWTEVDKFWRTAIILPYQQSPDEENDDNTVNGWLVGWSVDRIRRYFVSPYVCRKEDQDSFHSWLYFAHIRHGLDLFPEPTDIKINMMPFIVGRTFEDCRLPGFLLPYWRMIKACIQPEIKRDEWTYWPRSRIQTDLGKVYYLTIDESFVQTGKSQRRPGVHVDSPGHVKLRTGRGAGHTYYGHNWGRGCGHLTRSHTDSDSESTILYGGIYLASNIPNSCRVWNCGVSPRVVRRLGDVSHLTPCLPQPAHNLLANSLYWLTDRTPHESLPLTEPGYRQFFRLVTSEVSLWYRDHSTPNPLGVQPDPEITKVVLGDKFTEEGLEVVE